jgi:putative intracellular protease/amidase
MARILLVLSGSDHWTLKDGTRHPTGYWAEEFAVPYQMFRKAGLDVQISTPGGARPKVDEVSLTPERNGGDQQKAETLRNYLESIEAELARPLPLEEAVARSGDYDAVFIPGGHAPMDDLPTNTALGAVLTDLWNSGRLVAAICHGPAGLLSANKKDGTWLFAGRRLTAFTDEEERQAGLAERAPWLLESRLRERGAAFESGSPWQPYVVVDDTLLTGQNPASSEDTASRALAMLQALQR